MKHEIIIYYILSKLCKDETFLIYYFLLKLCKDETF